MLTPASIAALLTLPVALPLPLELPLVLTLPPEVPLQVPVALPLESAVALPLPLALAVGFAAAVAVAGAAWAKGSLSRSGAVAAVGVGTAVFGCGGWGWGALLLLFFVSSSALSRLQGGGKGAAGAKAAKGGRRDWAQVLANGGLAAALALGSVLAPAAGWWPAFVGAMATVTADTWATEIGTLSRSRPRSIVTGRPVEPGLSGGVTALGTAASLAGGALIGLAAGLVAGEPAAFLALGAVAGLCGSLADSLAGGTLQALWRCPACGTLTEAATHCSRPTRLARGHPAIGNDAVNLLASAVGAAAGGLAGL